MYVRSIKPDMFGKRKRHNRRVKEEIIMEQVKMCIRDRYMIMETV